MRLVPNATGTPTDVFHWGAQERALVLPVPLDEKHAACLLLILRLDACECTCRCEAGNQVSK